DHRQCRNVKLHSRHLARARKKRDPPPFVAQKNAAGMLIAPRKQEGRAAARPFLANVIAALALGELEAAPRLGLAVLLALDHAAVAGEEAAALERATQVRLEVGQRLRDAVGHRAGLSWQAAARARAGYVVLPG